MSCLILVAITSTFFVVVFVLKLVLNIVLELDHSVADSEVNIKDITPSKAILGRSKESEAHSVNPLNSI